MRTIWVIVAAAAVIALVSYGRWVANAPTAEEPTGDAVVVHAGSGERLRHGLELMDDGAAPTLVLIGGAEPYWRRANRLCGQQEPYEIVCPSPEPITTIGEARALAGLAAERQWDNVVTVTSDYHLRRAAYLDESCAGIEVTGSAAPSRRRLPSYLRAVTKEMAAMVQAAAAC